MLKDELLEFGNLYEEMRKEVLRIIEEIEPKLKDITDATILHSLKTRDFYWKHDLSTILGLSKKYGVDVSKLNEIWKKYVDFEQKISEKKKDFEKLGLKHVTIGPKSVTGFGDKNSQVCICIDIKRNKLDIDIHPKFGDEIEEKEFKRFASRLKDKIKKLLKAK